MSNFLDHMAARGLGLTTDVRPRLPSRYEAQPVGGDDRLRPLLSTETLDDAADSHERTTASEHASLSDDDAKPSPSRTDDALSASLPQFHEASPEARAARRADRLHVSRQTPAPAPESASPPPVEASDIHTRPASHEQSSQTGDGRPPASHDEAQLRSQRETLDVLRARGSAQDELAQKSLHETTGEALSNTGARQPTALDASATRAAGEHQGVSSLIDKFVVRSVEIRPAIESQAGTTQAGAGHAPEHASQPFMPLAVSGLFDEAGGDAAGATPTISIRIGRIDVRAVMPSPAPHARPATPRRHETLSLADYLKQRNGERR